MNRNGMMLLTVLACVAAAAAQDSGRESMQPLADAGWDRAAAAHLLRRAGFGGTPAEVDRLFQLGLDGAVSKLVDYADIPCRIAPPPVDPLLNEEGFRRRLRGLSEEQRREALQQRRAAERRTFEETRLWWLDRMLRSPRPFEEKMTLFWHGHFTSGMREVRNALFMKEQNEFLREHALGNFRDLLIGISRDRAMLVYLDGARNVKRAPNENYARELMELFTLGVGNYTERDIRAAARAFSGWSFDDDGFVFRNRNHDYGPKTFLRRTGDWHGEDVIDIIVEQPACSRYLAQCLLEFFVRAHPDRKLVERFAAIVRQNNYELKPSMMTLFKSRAFYHAESRAALVKSPVEVLVGSARQLGIPVRDLRAAQRAIAAMGQELMQPPNVKGWEGGSKWINTATLFNRYNFVGELIAGRPSRRTERRADEAASNDEAAETPEGRMMQMDMPAESRLKAGQQPPFDPLVLLPAGEQLSAEQVVDYFAGHLLASPLHPAKREMLIRYMLGDDGKFSLDEPGAKDVIQMMVRLLCSTPEYQLS